MLASGELTIRDVSSKCKGCELINVPLPRVFIFNGIFCFHRCFGFLSWDREKFSTGQRACKPFHPRGLPCHQYVLLWTLGVRFAIPSGSRRPEGRGRIDKGASVGIIDAPMSGDRRERCDVLQWVRGTALSGSGARSTARRRRMFSRSRCGAVGGSNAMLSARHSF